MKKLSSNLNLLNYFRVARAQTLVMSVLGILNSLAYVEHSYNVINYSSFLFVAISVICFHVAANTLSEYRDCKNGLDEQHSKGTKYRLVTGIVPERHVRIIGYVAFCIGCCSGIWALYFGSLLLFVPGIISALIAFLYSEGPYGFKYHALGEVCVFLGWGPLLFSSCEISLVGYLQPMDILFSIPFGFLVCCVLLANNIRDAEFEKGKTVTIPIKFGLKFSYVILFCLVHFAFLTVIFLVYLKMIPTISLLSLIGYLVVFYAAFKISSPKFINAFGIMLSVFGILMYLSFKIAEFIK
ncbi:MAG: prenyltransferase [Alphaproteobacteria bacterium]|nr:prenyltransferase [Alphaproteobacteria bacterium]